MNDDDDIKVDFNKKDANGLSILQWLNSRHLKTIVGIFTSQMAKKNRLAIESTRLCDEQRKIMVSANTGMIFFIDRLTSLPIWLEKKKDNGIEEEEEEENDSDR